MKSQPIYKNQLFEKKHEKLLPVHKFVSRQLKFAAVSALIIALSLAIGTCGYRYFADLDWIDAFYNASMILTGMGPVEFLRTDSAKLFSSFYALFSGVAFLTTTAVLFAPVIHRFIHLIHVEEEDLEKETSGSND